MTKIYVPSLSNFEWQPTVLAKDVNTPPVAPQPGDRYIVGSHPTGIWIGNPLWIAWYTGTEWEYIEPKNGMTLYIVDLAGLYTYLDGYWVVLLMGKYTFYQNTLSDTWNINHPLKTTDLQVSIWSDTNTSIIANMQVIDANNLMLSFTSEQQGRAILIG